MSTQKFSILIVDDNKSFISRMITLLNESDTTSIIHSANDVDEATSLITEKTNLVLLDINLPGKNGMSLLKKIKESANKCEVVMISNHTSEYYRQKCKKLGARLFLDKTNDFELVPGIVKEINREYQYLLIGS